RATGAARGRAAVAVVAARRIRARRVGSERQRDVIERGQHAVVAHVPAVDERDVVGRRGWEAIAAEREDLARRREQDAAAAGCGRRAERLEHALAADRRGGAGCRRRGGGG